LPILINLLPSLDEATAIKAPQRKVVIVVISFIRFCCYICMCWAWVGSSVAQYWLSFSFNTSPVSQWHLHCYSKCVVMIQQCPTCHVLEKLTSSYGVFFYFRTMKRKSRLDQVVEIISGCYFTLLMA